MPKFTDYKIADLSLASQGRGEIELAEKEMPGLMCLRSIHEEKPLKGERIVGCLHLTTQTAVLVETLISLGADVRWASCNIFSTHDPAAAALVDKGIPVYAWKGESLKDYWLNIYKTFQFKLGPTLIIDDGGDATLMSHLGLDYETSMSESNSFDFPNVDKELKDLLGSIYKDNPKFWRGIFLTLKGVSEETTTGVHRLSQMEKEKKLMIPAYDVNSSATKSKFDNLYGCRESLADGIKRATNTMIAGKVVHISGYGDVGKGCAQSMRALGACVYISEVDPICALQALMEGYTVLPIEDVVDKADIFVTATGCKDVITYSHMELMKDSAIVCNIGHFDDEIDMATLNKNKVSVKTIKPQVDVYTIQYEDSTHDIVVLASGRLVNLGCANGHPSFVMSMSFTNQVLAQLELSKISLTHRLSPKVYKLNRLQDEQAALLHLKNKSAKLTTLTPEQADYLNVSVSGPFKTDFYRY